MISNRHLFTHVWDGERDHVWIFVDWRHLDHLVFGFLLFSRLLLEGEDDLERVALNQVLTIEVHFVALALRNGLNLFSLLSCPLSLLFISLLYFFLCNLFWKWLFRFLSKPFGYALLFFSQSFAKVVDVGETVQFEVMISER